MIKAVEAMLLARRARTSRCCSSSAKSAIARAPISRRKHPRGSRYIINGEPTENKLALGSKGALRFEVIGEAARWRIRRIRNWASRRLRNCWTRWRRIRADQAARGSDAGREHAEYRHDHRRARAERHSGSCAWRRLFIRLVDDGDSTRAAVAEAVKGLAEAKRDPVHPGAASGIA